MVGKTSEAVLPRWPRWAPLLILTLAVAAVYSNTFVNPFVLDDHFSIVENPAIRRLWPLTAALNPPPADLTYCTRPLIHLTLCVDYALWGLNPLGFHLTNILLHATAVLVLWGLLRRTFARCNLDRPDAAAFAAALLWAVHPLNTAAVDYLSQRGELAVGLFLFLTLYCLNRAVTSSSPRQDNKNPRAGLEGKAALPGRPHGSTFWLLAAVFFCLLGMGSKENMAVAPLLAIFYDRHFLSSSWKEVFRRRGWLYIAMAVTVAWPLSRQWMFSPHLQPGVVTPDVMRRYWLTQAWGLTRLWRLVVWPAPLVFDYGTLLASGLREVLPHLVVVLLVVGATFWAGVRRPRAGFAGLCFFGLLAPSLLLPITGQPIAEHRLYAPMAALIALFVAGCIQLGRRAHWDSRVGSAALALATLLLGGASFHRNTTYRSGIALMEDVIAKRPGNGRAWQNLGVFLQAAGQMDQALEAYSRALLLNPSDKRALSNRALLRFQQGQWNPALADLNRWLQLAPDSADALIRRAVVWTRLGDPVRAEQDYGRALASGNATAPQLNNLAWLLATTERILDPPRAIELAQRAVDISGRDYRTLDTLAVAYAAAGEFEQARAITIEARDRARARKDAAFAAKLEGRLERYRKNHPWRED